MNARYNLSRCAAVVKSAQDCLSPVLFRFGRVTGRPTLIGFWAERSAKAFFVLQHHQTVMIKAHAVNKPDLVSGFPHAWFESGGWHWRAEDFGSAVI